MSTPHLRPAGDQLHRLAILLLALVALAMTAEPTRAAGPGPAVEAQRGAFTTPESTAVQTPRQLTGATPCTALVLSRERMVQYALVGGALAIMILVCGN